MRPGTVLADRFEIERAVGAGGMGSVYRARDRAGGATVALKVLHGGAGAESARFLREANILAELAHPSVVRYVAHGTAGTGEAWLAMEWLEGEDLRKRLERGALTISESLTLLRHAADGLAAAHRRGVVHRDLKPANLFLPGGAADAVRLLDFGIARAGGVSRTLTRAGVVMGTPAYMAPEQARGDDAVDARADVFSLGCVLFECLTGRPAFVGEHVMAVLAKVLLEEPARVSELRTGIPPDLDALLAAMLSKDPGERPPDAAAVSVALAGIDLDEAIASTVLVSPRLTSGERRVLSVMLVGPTGGPRPGSPTVDVESALAERPAPGTTSEIIERARAAVAAFRGRFDVLADGSSLAVMEGTGVATDMAERAARCALRVRAELPDARIGLATGLVDANGRGLVGEVLERAAALVGGQAHREGAASRSGVTPRSAAPDSTDPPVLVDDATAGLLGPRFATERRAGGGFTLHGEREVPDPARTLLGRPTPFRGRERELTQLEAIYDECIGEPVARAVLVIAPAGVGKSRLARELVRRIEPRGDPVEVWLAQGDPMHAGSPFGFVSRILRDAADLRPGDDLDAQRTKLRARVGRHLAAADADRAAEFLGEIAGVPFPDEGSVRLRAARREPTLMGDQTRRAWEDFLAAECAATPVLLVLEDLQWGDRPTVGLMDAALRHLGERALMVLAVARPEVGQLFPDLWSERDVTVLRMSGLSRKASERLARDVLGDAITAADARRLADLADGNAFYLEELIRATAEGRGAELPETVLAMVQARLEALEPEQRRILRAASVFGGVFWSGGVTALLGGSEVAPALEPWLDDLVRRELVARRDDCKLAGETEYAFRHALVREGAYGMLTGADRVLGHRLAGGWLEGKGEGDALALAEHFERGEEPARAIGWYRKAAELALEGNDFGAAIARAERAVACGASGTELGALRLLQSSASRWRADVALARDHAAAAMDLLPRGGDPWCAAAVETVLACQGNRTMQERLVELVEALSGIASAGDLTGPQVIASVYATSTLARLIGRSPAILLLLAAVERAEPAFTGRDPAALSQIHYARAEAALHAGDLAAFVEHLAAAVECLESAGDRRTASLNRGNIGFGYLQLGAYEDARDTLRSTLAEAKRMGLAWMIASAANNLGFVLAHLGDLAEAESLERLAVTAFAAQKDDRNQSVSRACLAQILALRGRIDEGIAEARRAVDVGAGILMSREYSLATLASLLLARGLPSEALAAAREGMDLLRAAGSFDEGEALLRLAHAEALRATGDRAGARAEIAAARARVEAKAAKIGRSEWRESFLRRVPENARTLALAREWSEET